MNPDTNECQSEILVTC